MARSPRILAAVSCALALAVGGSAYAQPADGDGETPPDSGDSATRTEPTPPPADEVDVQALRKEYLRLREKLFRSRARAAAVASALYSSKLQIRLDYGSGRYYAVKRATIRLDGSNIFDDTDGTITKDKAPRFEGYVAPGRHQLSVRIEADGKDDRRFSSIIDNTFTVQAVGGSDLVVKATAEDGGDIPYKWKRKKRGSYKLHLNIKIDTVKRSTGAKGKKHAKGK